VKQVTKYVIKNNLKRLFTYRVCLISFKRKGFDRVFSYNLGEEASVSAEQVRKDFSEFKIKGNKKGGYQIDYLLHAIDEIFKFQHNEHIILIGMGNIGRALVQYKRFVLRKMIIVATFDIDPSKQTKRWGIPVLPLEQLDEIIHKFYVRTAIVAVPEISAQEICDILVKSGIKGILNFAPIIPKVPVNVVVKNINLCDELQSVIYYVDKQIMDS